MTDRPDDDDVDDDAGAGAGEPVPEPDGPLAPVGRGGRTVRIGCYALAFFGILAIVFAGLTVLNPEQAVCGAAVAELEDADEPALDPDEVDCGDADERAAAIAAAEEANGDDDLPDEGVYRTSGLIGVLVGAALAAGAVLTLRTRSRRARLVALVAAGLSVVFLLGLLFPLSIVLLGFGVYAIFFSADARAMFGEPGGLRRRPG